MLEYTMNIFDGLTGQFGINTFHTEGDAPEDADPAVDAIYDFYTALQGVMSSDITVQIDPSVKNINPATGVLIGIVPATGTTLTGTATGDRNSLATQGLVRWQTASVVAGRRVGGRTFIPGSVEGNSSGGRPDSTYQLAVEDAAGLLLATVGFVVWSRTAGVTSLITAGLPYSEWAVLRSRRD